MQSYPHTYRAAAATKPDSAVELTSAENPPISSGPPPEFGGPGGVWSPEHLLVAAVSDCYVLSFKALAKATHFAWETIQCEVAGSLERVGNTTKFTTFQLRVQLTIDRPDAMDKAHELLERAEATCFITNSLSASAELYTEVLVAQ